jgi:hypothetical protein
MFGYQQCCHCLTPGGATAWAYYFPGEVISSPVSNTRGMALLADENFTLQAFGPCPPPAQTSWPMFRHDLRHTGRVGGP